MPTREVALVTGAGTGLVRRARGGRCWLVDGARTVTGELVLLDSGMHLAGVRPPGR